MLQVRQFHQRLENHNLSWTHSSRLHFSLLSGHLSQVERPNPNSSSALTWSHFFPLFLHRLKAFVSPWRLWVPPCFFLASVWDPCFLTRDRTCALCIGNICHFLPLFFRFLYVWFSLWTTSLLRARSVFWSSVYIPPWCFSLSKVKKKILWIMIQSDYDFSDFKC